MFNYEEQNLNLEFCGLIQLSVSTKDEREAQNAPYFYN